jgi:hypothetical protein
MESKQTEIKEWIIHGYMVAIKGDNVDKRGDPLFWNVNPIPCTQDEENLSFRPELVDKASDKGQALYYASCFHKHSDMESILKAADRHDVRFRRLAAVALCRAILTRSRETADVLIAAECVDYNFCLSSYSDIREERFLFRVLDKRGLYIVPDLAEKVWLKYPRCDIDFLTLAKLVEDDSMYEMLSTWVTTEELSKLWCDKTGTPQRPPAKDTKILNELTHPDTASI